jgi:hypothetical protein
MVKPLMFYGTPAWHPSTKANEAKFERVHVIIISPKKKTSLRGAICNPLKGNWPIRLSLGQTKKKKKKKNAPSDLCTGGTLWSRAKRSC